VPQSCHPAYRNFAAPDSLSGGQLLSAFSGAHYCFD
jgi:hypothetical protein